MSKVTSVRNSNQTSIVCDDFFDGKPKLKTHQIKHIDDYEIILPEWLKNCIKNIPPGTGESCPRDSEALLVQL